MGITPKQFLSKLVEKNIITDEQASQYEVDSMKRDLPIDLYLLQYTTISPDEIMKIKAGFLNVKYISIGTTAVDPQALSYIPESVAQRHSIMPYMYDDKEKRLYVASADPLNVSLQDFIEMKAGIKATLALALPEDISKAISVGYTRSISPEVEKAIAQVEPQKKATVETGIRASKEFNNAPIAKIVNTILDFAMKSRASDIHIEPQELKSRVRYRIDGILQEKLSLPTSIHESLVSRIKILSEMKIDEKRVPQDGRFNYKNTEEEIDLRVSTLPTVNGEKIVMRLLRKSGGMPSLGELGLDGAQLKRFEDGIARSYGIVLVTGPTGSGKTTTLYSVLSRLNTKAVNIVTLEDPVEYQVEGINQVQINTKAGLTFATGLKSFLRQDPNIILVGEIRDTETTQLAIQAALTGHLVFSTLHTNDAATAIPRLTDLGGEPFLIASVLSIAMAQRIVRRVCETCKEVYEPPIELQNTVREVLGPLLPKEYQTDRPIQLVRGKKCEDCNNSGYKGRIGIYEILKTSAAINDLILKERPSQEIVAQAQKEGMVLMKQDGFLKALRGETSLEEVMRVTEAA
ncbi:type II secretion system protein GspE [Candidatus Roizmanbacteria bacterium CG_4_10_14_0_2_um_filter_39_13]|uniref:Type II secretion system protein GspE n=1 Tax=Candidatus Roizmanbacteria bacterium CG_4_10_14_0_2_um_filter_39_13 TaxID=1974825 RepID=A0A2M7TZT2_9BACT|nr:MAG: type II secretion system protein GspE [Candidatus Roizmanbacteria bacterium CG_4_10_14_0_2_um_filter_39_13]